MEEERKEQLHIEKEIREEQLVSKRREGKNNVILKRKREGLKNSSKLKRRE